MKPFWLQTRDGLALSAKWRLTRSRESRAAVVLVHGFTGSKDNPEIEAFAAGLAVGGYDVLSFNTRGHKDSEGACTLGDREQLDVEAAVREARTRHEKVVVFGASMGAISALRYAAGDDSLAGAVSLSAPARWRMPRSAPALLATWMTRTSLGRWFADRFLDVTIDRKWTNPAPPEQLVGEIRVPLAVVHGQSDPFIDAGEARRLAHAAAGPTRLELVPRMGHAFDEKGIGSILRSVSWTLAVGTA